jgi:biopolymer transport protein ExbB
MLHRFAVALLLVSLPCVAQAWWSADWPFRKKITLEAAKVEIKEGLTGFVAPVRLHTGNFLFADAKEDGADIRFVSGDDKTPLKFQIEAFDPKNELAVLWVQVPKLAASEAVWMYYGNRKAQAGADPKGIADPAATLVLRFGEREGAPKDSTAYANSPTQSTVALGAPAVLANGATLDGAQRMLVPAAPSLKLNPQAGFTFSAWIKPEGAQTGAVLYAQADGPRSVQIVLDGGRAVARVVAVGAKPIEAAAPVPDGAWTHLAVTLSNRLVVYVNGAEAGAVPAAVPDIGGDLSIGAAPDGKSGFRGQLDQIELANAARSADWIKAQFASQTPEGPFVAYGADEETGGGGHSYFGILIDNLTLDAWIIIVVLLIMFAWSLVIMALKAVFLSRTERANQGFIEKFEELSDDLLRLDPDAAAAGGGPNGHPAAERKYDSPFRRSPIYRIYHSGVREVLHRFETARKHGTALNLTPQAIEAIRAVLDARIVRENQRLNAQMVLLTIAISGGPFIGLLGTVLGVMITFAAVAAAGDVNVNAIAPGIAAALLATVAGLAVAIPALFGYNWLASRIKSVQNDMSVFADELLTKFAENYTT